MNAEQGPQQAPGSVPNAFGNALAWKWVPNMPAALRRTRFTTLLYVLRTMSNAAGEMRFNGDRKAIRIQDIARAAGIREKDARSFLEAAEAAGLVTVKGERRRGKPTLYVLLLCPNPNWGAALDVVEAKKQPSGQKPPPWKQTESSGDRSPNSFGHPQPEPSEDGTEEVRATAAPSGSGHRSPNGSGDRSPNNPGKAKGLPQDMAGLGEQPQEVAAPDGKDDHSNQGQDQDGAARPDLGNVAAFTFCPECGNRFIPRRNRLNDRCPACNGTSTAKNRSAS